jgi:hypothetical protein
VRGANKTSELALAIAVFAVLAIVLSPAARSNATAAPRFFKE